MAIQLRADPRESTSIARADNGFDFGAALEMARVLVNTGFLPRAVNTPEKAVAIIMTGRELGLPPMYALRTIHIIEGKPTLAAELQLAMFIRRGGKVRWVESTDKAAEVALAHWNGATHTERFTIEDAARAKLTTKDNWQKYPKMMLRARAASAGLRAIAPDIQMGLYDPDEIGSAELPPLTIAETEPETQTPNLVARDDQGRVLFPLPRNKYSGKPLGEVSIPMLQRALDYFDDKVERGEGDDRTEQYARAIAAELDSRMEEVDASAAKYAQDSGQDSGEASGAETDVGVHHADAADSPAAHPASSEAAPASSAYQPDYKGGAVPKPGRIQDALDLDDEKPRTARGRNAIREGH